ncbi:hypothetical protein [Kitasatospora sp. NBC_01302]|uniref:hypothetical protein n=1 Tax=Kitasatospora sp. NBC_01302 TaxID=2903575 RepID=UPI002E0D5993|nr:hypothetical protein OG294_19645 [Kitasatospora sp. NBC_01302]
MNLHWRLAPSHGRSPALILTQRPNPNCPHCFGDGGFDYGDEETGEYAGTDLCPCWHPGHHFRLLPLPSWAARRWFGWREPVYSDEPPF